MITDAAWWTESIQTLHFSENGAQVPKNYHQARKQRELARKARGNAVIAIVATSAGAVRCLYGCFLMDTGAPHHTLHCHR